MALFQSLLGDVMGDTNLAGEISHGSNNDLSLRSYSDMKVSRISVDMVSV